MTNPSTMIALKHKDEEILRLIKEKHQVELQMMKLEQDLIEARAEIIELTKGSDAATKFLFQHYDKTSF